MRLYASAREPCARRARPRFVSRLRIVEVLADRVIYEEFAHFLSNSDKTEKSGGTTIEYLRKVLGLARDLYGKHPRHRRSAQTHTLTLSR